MLSIYQVSLLKQIHLPKFSYDPCNVLFQDGRMNVYGLSDDNEAQQLYSQFEKSIK